jgi:hypothetical protein
MGISKIEHWTLLDGIDGAVEQLDAYRQVGVQEFLLMALGSEPLIQYERLAEVRSRLRAGLATPGAAAEARG